MQQGRFVSHQEVCTSPCQPDHCGRYSADFQPDTIHRENGATSEKNRAVERCSSEYRCGHVRSEIPASVLEEFTEAPKRFACYSAFVRDAYMILPP